MFEYEGAVLHMAMSAFGGIASAVVGGLGAAGGAGRSVIVGTGSISP